MYGWCKLINDDEKQIEVAYSLGKNNSCDGKLIFDKKTKEVTIAKLSTDSEEVLTKAFICPLRCRMYRKGLIPDKLTMIMTG